MKRRKKRTQATECENNSSGKWPGSSEMSAKEPATSNGNNKDAHLSNEYGYLSQSVDMGSSKLYNRRKLTWRGSVNGAELECTENSVGDDAILSSGSAQSSPDVTSEDTDEKESGYVTLEDLQAQRASEDDDLDELDDDNALSDDEAKKENPSRDTDVILLKPMTSSSKSPKEIKSPRNLKSPRELKSPRNLKSPREFSTGSSSSPKGDPALLRFTFTVKLGSKMFKRRQSVQNGSTEEVVITGVADERGESSARVLDSGKTQLLTPNMTVVDFTVHSEDNGNSTGANFDDVDGTFYRPFNRSAEVFKFPASPANQLGFVLSSSTSLGKQSSATTPKTVSFADENPEMFNNIMDVKNSEKSNEYVSNTISKKKMTSFAADCQDMCKANQDCIKYTTLDETSNECERLKCDTSVMPGPMYDLDVLRNKQLKPNASSILQSAANLVETKLAEFDNGTYLKPVLPQQPHYKPSTHVWAKTVERPPQQLRWQKAATGKSKMPEPTPDYADELVPAPGGLVEGEVEATHMSWKEVVEEAHALGIPLRQPSSSESTHSNTVKRSSSFSAAHFDKHDGCCTSRLVSKHNTRPTQLKVDAKDYHKTTTATNKENHNATSVVGESGNRDETATKQRKSLKDLFRVPNIFGHKSCKTAAQDSKNKGDEIGRVRFTEKSRSSASRSVPPSRGNNPSVQHRRGDNRSILSPLSPNASHPGELEHPLSKKTANTEHCAMNKILSQEDSRTWASKSTDEDSLRVQEQQAAGSDSKLQCRNLRKEASNVPREKVNLCYDCDGGTLSGHGGGSSMKRVATSLLSPSITSSVTSPTAVGRSVALPG